MHAHTLLRSTTLGMPIIGARARVESWVQPPFGSMYPKSAFAPALEGCECRVTTPVTPRLDAETRCDMVYDMSRDGIHG